MFIVVSSHNMSPHTTFLAIFMFILLYGSPFLLLAGHPALKPPWVISKIGYPVSSMSRLHGSDLRGGFIGVSLILLFVKNRFTSIVCLLECGCMSQMQYLGRLIASLYILCMMLPIQSYIITLNVFFFTVGGCSSNPTSTSIHK